MTARLDSGAGGGDLVKELERKDRVSYAAFSPDGQFIVTASNDSSAWLWNVSGTLVRKLRGHTGDVAFVSFSPDNECVVTGTYDQTGRIWKLDGTRVRELKHNGAVRDARLTASLETLLQSSFDGAFFS